jgi:uncharacterized membrane protein SpoIIM required for sporulation
VKLDRFLAERTPDWNELDELLARGGPSANRLTARELLRLGSLYRASASDLAVARRYFTGTPGALRLQSLVARAYGVVYGRVQREDTFATFFSRSLWRRIYECLHWVRLAMLIMFVGALAGTIWALHDPSGASSLIPGLHVHSHVKGAFYGLPINGRGGLAIEIFTNNILVSCLCMLGGFTCGILTSYMLLYNGALLGILGALEWRARGFTDFLRLVVPHGLLELSCVSLAGGAGFLIAKALIDPGKRTRRDALAQISPRVGACTLGFITFLVAAGLTEGFITPWDLPLVPALCVGVALAGVFWTGVLWRGRPAHHFDAGSESIASLERQVRANAG